MDDKGLSKKKNGKEDWLDYEKDAIFQWTTKGMHKNKFFVFVLNKNQ